MELFILIVVLAILAETTLLLLKSNRKLKNGNGRRKVYVDTSVLIDGRITNIAKTGFLGDEMLILKSVLKELQLLADGKDSEKRNRARAGLETASELERIVYFNTEIVDDGEGNKSVDEQLLKYAKENHGMILTLDYNLVKRATAERIETLNINDLSISLRSEFVPGEKFIVKITEKGSGKGQGVGHLKDGTMVVIDNASKKLNEVVEAEFLRFHETSAGKIAFAKLLKTK